MGRLPEQVDLLEAGRLCGVICPAHHTAQHALQALHKLLGQLVLLGCTAVQLPQLGWQGGVNKIVFFYLLIIRHLKVVIKLFIVYLTGTLCCFLAVPELAKGTFASAVPGQEHHH